MAAIAANLIQTAAIARKVKKAKKAKKARVTAAKAGHTIAIASL
ncbi:MAG TPA: hypothetical protein VEZ17_17405 [Chitinophagaceae bacterium]|nr:hypothetical protein [Chitinophagaceae bacterium]